VNEPHNSDFATAALTRQLWIPAKNVDGDQDWFPIPLESWIPRTLEGNAIDVVDAPIPKGAHGLQSMIPATIAEARQFFSSNDLLVTMQSYDPKNMARAVHVVRILKGSEDDTGGFEYAGETEEGNSGGVIVLRSGHVLGIHRGSFKNGPCRGQIVMNDKGSLNFE